MTKAKSKLQTKTTTKQVVKNYKNGSPNPTGKGGFANNPQNRSDGRWSAEDSISYQYKKLMRMTLADMAKWYEDNQDTITVAQDIAYGRIRAAKKSLLDAKEITDRTEGKAPMFIGVGGTEDYSKILVEFIDHQTDVE